MVLFAQWGRDPFDDVNNDLRDGIVDHINERASIICPVWRWPEWEITEERAFRQIWNSGEQYGRVSTTDGNPDEVFYLGTSFVAGGAFGADYGYYRVSGSAVTDPPIGTVPTNTAYWEQINPVDTFIAYDQQCRRFIGMVLGVYSQNPRVPTGSMNGALRFQPSERGIDVLQVGVPTVFVTYKMPIPEYSMMPFVTGKTYVRGDVVFDPTTGECFQALLTTTDVPSNISSWRRIPFLAVWKNYVTNGAFSDTLMDFDQGGNEDLQAKAVLSQSAGETADRHLQLEVDKLAMQGQTLQWSFCKNRHTQWCESIPFTGGSVTTLTETCQSDLGWVYPSPGVELTAGLIYLSSINSLKTTTPTLIANFSTIGRAPLTMVLISTGQQFRLDPGPYDSGDPGSGQPSDYSLASNDVHWTEVI